MTTICADRLPDSGGLLHHERAPQRAHYRPEAAANEERPRHKAVHGRFEAFEARSSGLGDLLGGQIFPRFF